MKQSWKYVSLGDALTLQRGFDLPAYEREEGPIPVVTSSGPSGTHSHFKVTAPGVVTGRYGTIGQVFFLRIPFWPLNTTLWVKDFKGNDERFIYYLLQTVDFASCSDKSSVPGVNRNHLHTIPVSLPPLPEQIAIADILGSLDDKIELNRRTNETLEAMARALFKSWFVDFDPVVAKSEGRKPEGMDADTANLFPSSFEDSEIGRVPRGWIAERLTNLTTPTKGTSYTSDELHESTTALVTLKSFKRGGGYRHDGLKPYTGRYKPEQVVTPGEVVMACTDVTQAAEVVGRPAIVEADPLFQTLVASLDTVIIRPSRKAIPKSFIFCLLKTDDFQNHTYAHCTGTTVLHLSKEALPSFRLPLPSDQVLDAFARLAAPLFARMAVNNTEVCSIGSLRDALLPRLLSGDLRNDIEGEYV